MKSLKTSDEIVDEIISTYAIMLNEIDSEKISEEDKIYKKQILQGTVEIYIPIVMKRSKNRIIGLKIELYLVFVLLLINSFYIGYTVFYSNFGYSMLHFCLSSYLIWVYNNMNFIYVDMKRSAKKLLDFFKKIDKNIKESDVCKI